jgi:predicted ArsR family transcriptional regulator
MRTSRQLILDYIRVQKSVTSFDLSRALGMTQANARHHLEILLEEGAIQITGHRQVQARGRPSRIFSLSESLLGHNFDRLAVVLLTDFTEEDDFRLMDLAKKITRLSRLQKEPVRAGLPARLYSAVKSLNEMHYSAHWEAHASGPRMILGHCPYRAIIDDHPVLCKLDEKILQSLVDFPTEQVAKLAEDGKGGKVCVFRIKNR